MEENKKEEHKETLYNSLKESWQKVMLLCGKQLIKAGTNILAKIGEEEPQKDLPEECVAPTYQVDNPTGYQEELQPVGNANYPDAEDEFIDSPIETPNEEKKAEPENKDASESDGSPSMSDADNTPATDVDSSLSSIKLVHNAANLINEYDRQATEAEDEFIDSPIETPNEEKKAEPENKDASESDGSPSMSDADNTPATDVDSSLSSIKLVHNAANLINEYDRQATEAEDNGFRTLYNDAANRLIENLILAGCTGINPQEDEPFDFNRHATRPFSLPSNQLIKKTIRLGVALNDEVLVKAIVELK